MRFAAGQVTAVIPINIVADEQPEEAEAFVLKLLPSTVTGNAEVDEPMEVSAFSLMVLFERKTGCTCCRTRPMDVVACVMHVCDLQ